MYKKLLKTSSVFVLFVATGFFSKAQTCTNAQLEMAASALGAVNPTTNGHSMGNHVIILQNNSSSLIGSIYFGILTNV